jgi:adenine-specific DNA-methyltransferase
MNKHDKLKMHSVNKVDENVERIAQLFPNCVTEAIVEDKLTKVVDFDMLKQELSSFVVEGNEERYQFTWPDKKKSILLANAPIAKTLRPCKEESVDFDKTENLYIEGDNLDVLKLLQETYLGKVKMIYIDPPYNTGNDFVYEDDFAQNTDEYLANSGQYDEEGNRLVKNLDSNGRFHTDWLNMMYPRLKLAKDLLTDDGVIFISIDDNEQKNLKSICDEVFGGANFVAQCIRRTINSGKHDTQTIAVYHEYVLVYAKSINNIVLTRKPKNDDERDRLYPEKDRYEKERGRFYVSQLNKNSIRYSDSLNFPIVGPDGVDIYPGGGFEDKEWCWRWGKEKVKWGLESDYIVFKQQGDKYKVYAKSYEFRDNNGEPIERTNPYSTLEFVAKEYGNFNATPELSSVFDGKKYFDFPKSVVFIKESLKLANSGDGIILDFFSGSATTAHAVMQLNAEDGGNRKFIMVQLPEETDEKSEAYKAGYKNICEIGKERIRRAGNKVKEENKDKDGIENLDIGFRVLKCDSTNMKDVYYNPADYEASLFDALTDNIKEDRTPEDLLFQVMLDLGVLLSSKIEESMIAGKKVFNVADGFLIACFDDKVKEETIKAIAQQKPYYFVMRDSSMATDSVAANFEQIFATYSPDTVRKVL